MAGRKLSPAQQFALCAAATGELYGFVRSGWLNCLMYADETYKLSTFRALISRGLVEPWKHDPVKLTEAGRVYLEERGLLP